jgi:hypothetical protein
MIHHGVTAELNALRIVDLHAEADRRRKEAALPLRRRRRPALLRAFLPSRNSAPVPETSGGGGRRSRAHSGDPLGIRP